MCVCVCVLGGVGGSVRWKGVENPVALSGPTYEEEATVSYTRYRNVRLPSYYIYYFHVLL